MEKQQVPQTLMEAAEAGDINLLYGCIQDYPKILDSIDEIPFVDTPLHKAASAGHAHFALEMMRLMPSFGKKLNPQGLSPLDLALRSREGLSPEDLDLRNRITSTIRRLINLDKELIRVKGRESFTPLHYVAEKGDIDLLAEFLLACPESIMDRTIRDETALHIAVKNSKLQAFEVLLGCLRRIRKHQHVLGWKDDEGNTLLHIAVSTSQTQVVKSLLQRNFLLQTKSLHDNKINLDKNAKNLEGRTALDIATTVVDPGEAQREIKEALDHAGASESTSLREDYCSFANFFMSPQCIIEFFTQQWFYQGRELTMETRNAILVVAVLIATTTFQAILSPPGGVVGGTGDNNNQLTANENHINATIISITTNNNLIPTYNVSYINATIFTNIATTNTSSTMDPSKRVLFKRTKFNGPITYGSFFQIFYSLNTTCFLASVMAIIFLLPLQLFSLFLYGPLFLLMLSYGASFAVISPPTSYTIKFLLSSCVFAIWIYFMGPLNIAIGGNVGAVFPLIFVVGRRRKRLQMLLHLLERS